MIAIAIVSFFTSMLLGMIWYHPSVFGSTWIRHAHPGKTQQQLDSEVGSHMKYIKSVIGHIVLSFIIKNAMAALQVGTIFGAVHLAAHIALIAFLAVFPHMLYENEPLILSFINRGFDTTVIFLLTIANFILA